ncbi:MAG: putative transitional endoplasmic reticulum ATPase, partial [Streblomastix strix]
MLQIFASVNSSLPVDAFTIGPQHLISSTDLHASINFLHYCSLKIKDNQSNTHIQTTSLALLHVVENKSDICIPTWIGTALGWKKNQFPLKVNIQLNQINQKCIRCKKITLLGPFDTIGEDEYAVTSSDSCFIITDSTYIETIPGYSPNHVQASIEIIKQSFNEQILISLSERINSEILLNTLIEKKHTIHPTGIVLHYPSESVSKSSIPTALGITLSQTCNTHCVFLIAPRDGYEKTIQKLQESAIWPVLYSDDLKRLGIGDSNVGNQCGIILHGPCGCGKTVLARSISDFLKCNIYIGSPASLLRAEFGGSEAAIRSLFVQAREQLPSVVIIEGLDILAPRRGGRNFGGSGNGNGNDSGNDAHTRLLCQLLTELDGRKLIIIGTARDISAVDEALLRPGRFTSHIHVPYPNEADRCSIILSIMMEANIKVEQISDRTLIEDINEKQQEIQVFSQEQQNQQLQVLAEEAAKVSEGLSCAALKTAVREAIMLGLAKCPEIEFLQKDEKNVQLKSITIYAHDLINVLKQMRMIRISSKSDDSIRDIDDMSLFTSALSGIGKLDEQSANLINQAATSCCQITLPLKPMRFGITRAVAFEKGEIKTVALCAMKLTQKRWYHTRLNTQKNMIPNTIEKICE